MKASVKETAKGSSRSGRSASAKQRKQQTSERVAGSEPKRPAQSESAELTGSFALGVDTEDIFAPEPPQDSSAPAEWPALPHEATTNDVSKAIASARRRGMGSWYFGVALCLLGSGYIAYHLLNEGPRSSDSVAPAAAESQAAAKKSQPGPKEETIHKLPTAEATVTAAPHTAPTLERTVQSEQPDEAVKRAETPVASLTPPAPTPEPYPIATTKPPQVVSVPPADAPPASSPAPASVPDETADAAMMTTAGDDSASDVKPAPVPSEKATKPAETPVTSLTPSGPAPEPYPIATTKPPQVVPVPPSADAPPDSCRPGSGPG